MLGYKLRAMIVFNDVRMGGLEPPRLSTPDPKSGAAAITPHARVVWSRKVTNYFSIEKIKIQFKLSQASSSSWASSHMLIALSRRLHAF